MFRVLAISKMYCVVKRKVLKTPFVARESYCGEINKKVTHQNPPNQI